MKIIYRRGNLLDFSGHYIAHGCNAQGKMNSGVAKAIRDYDENVFTVYARTYAQNEDSLVLGSLIAVDTRRFQVLNCITQEFYRVEGDDPDTRYVSYPAVEDAMKAVNDWVKNRYPPWECDLDEVGLPLLGAGLAGGDWNIISKIIETHAVNFQPVVYIQDIGKMPKGYTFTKEGSEDESD